MKLRWALAHALLMLLSTAGGSWAGGATVQVKAILDQAVEIQFRPDLQGRENRQQKANEIRTLLRENCLVGEMAKASLGSYWAKLSPQQGEEFREIFGTLFQDSYTRMVLNFLRRETMEYGDEKSVDSVVRVPTIIMRANEHIPVVYDMAKRDERWFIRDVEIDGVSIVENYRNAFRRVIAKHSFDELMSKMRLQMQAIQHE